MELYPVAMRLMTVLAEWIIENLMELHAEFTNSMKVCILVNNLNDNAAVFVPNFIRCGYFRATCFCGLTSKGSVYENVFIVLTTI